MSWKATAAISGAVIAHLALFGAIMLLWQRTSDQPTPDPINPDYTQVTTDTAEEPLVKRIIEQIITRPDRSNTASDDNTSKVKRDSTIITFQDNAAKETFIRNNNLRESDLQQIGQRNSYVVTKPVDELALDDTATTQPNIPYKALLVPDDPLHSGNYYPSLIGLESAWDTTTGDSTIVAVIDTGFALNHEDMQNRWHINAAEYGSGKESNGVDDDSNGLIDDWRGWDFSTGIGGDNDPQAGTTDSDSAYASHGTNTSGLVGATGNNDTGVASANWLAKILPIQVLADSGSGYTSDVVSAVDYAVTQGASVINLSLGSTTSDPALQTAIEDAVNAGVTVVAAAGNCGGDDYDYQGCTSRGQMSYPALYDEVIAVGATMADDERASYSSWGAALDITAPGGGAIRTPTWAAAYPTQAYTSSAHGTSIASPIIAGVAALIKAEFPGYTPAQVKAALQTHAHTVSAMRCQDSTKLYGAGRVQADDSVENGIATIEQAACPKSLMSHDFDNDGFGDLMWHRSGTSSDVLWFGTGTRGLFSKRAFDINGSYKTYGGDFDGDNYEDILLYAPGKANDFVLYGSASRGQYDAKKITVNGTLLPVVGDFNGDGRDDVFWHGPNSLTDQLWRGSTTRGAFQRTTFTINGTRIPIAGDFDGDGYSDIFWYRPGSASEKIWFGRTSGSFSGRDSDVGGNYIPITNDFDGDGYSDILWYAPGSTKEYIWYGQSARGSFDKRRGPAASKSYSPMTGDLNGDGRGDIFWYAPGVGIDRIWYGSSVRGSFQSTTASQNANAIPLR